MTFGLHFPLLPRGTRLRLFLALAIPSSHSLTVATLVLIHLAATAHDTPNLTANAGPLLRSRHAIMDAELTITLDDVKRSL